MSNCRFMYNNLITSETMLAVSSLRNGVVMSALKNGTGSASMATSGLFTGQTDREYIVEIDSIVGGAEVGQATFKWSDGSGGWNATGVTTPSSATELNNGVYIAFTSGTGADFVVGDKWYFKAVNMFNAGKMLTLSRDDRYRSAAIESPNTISITFDSEQAIDAVIIYDHNLTSAATITLWGDDAATFDSAGGSPQVVETITWTTEKILHYLTTSDRTKRYWQLRIDDAANPDLYIEIGELFFGSYFSPSKNYRYGESIETEFITSANKSQYGVRFVRFANVLEVFALEFAGLPDSDITSFKALLDAITDRSTQEQKPIYFNHDPASPSDVLICNIESFKRTKSYTNQNEVSIDMREVARSV